MTLKGDVNRKWTSNDRYRANHDAIFKKKMNSDPLYPSDWETLNKKRSFSMKKIPFGLLILLAFAILAYFLSSCGKSHPKEDEPITSKLELYRTADMSMVTPCDSGTFWTHAAAVGVHKELVAVLEQTPGRIERFKEPCYPNESKSEASREMYIGWLHFIWSSRDSPALKRLIAYGDSHGWIFGEGPSDLVDMTPLRVIIYLMDRKMNLTLAADASDEDLNKTLAGFKGHVLASYLWLWGRVNNQIGPLGMSTIRSLVDASPGNPMYQALLHRFTDGDQTVASGILNNEENFPSNEIPKGMANFGWGSCPDWLMYLIVDGIIRGI